ncbi:hypothetical protein [Qipengyuania sphaerica]|uniref:hypothetical protein n=1 Tax=Qipengyuania sphaerica TaxID=2867243 RepID=UPI001C86BA5F|nr:hypothetical protein [Qipengyuania sphaerica]MBX7539398.1 hypothetical protein [Qipengyuania sphaerica]
MRRIVHSTLICASLLLMACEQTPTGQVAAIVDGDEITIQEINGELASMRLPQSFDPELARNIALQRVIDRRLLARAAREEGLDQTPEFFIRQRELIDNMLIDQLRDKLQRAVATPTDAELSDYARSHPEAFEQRKLLEVDQITFPVLADPQALSALKDDHSMDEVAKSLTDMGVVFKRSRSQLDTAMLGADRLRQIAALPEGEPFILPGPRVITIAVVMGEQAAERDAQAMPSQIADRIKREELAELLETRLETAKSSAQIQYQAGYEPPPKEESPAT